MRLASLALLAALSVACSNPVAPTAPTYTYVIKAPGGATVTLNGHGVSMPSAGEYHATGQSATLIVRLLASGCLFATVAGPTGPSYGDLQCGDSPTVTVTVR